VFTRGQTGNGTARRLRRGRGSAGHLDGRASDPAQSPAPGGRLRKRAGARDPAQSVFAGALERLDRAVMAHVLGEDGADALRGHLGVVDLVLPAHELEVLLAERVRRAGPLLADDHVGSEVAEAVAPAPGEGAPAAEIELPHRVLGRDGDPFGAVATAVWPLADGDAVGGHANQFYGVGPAGGREAGVADCSSVASRRSSRRTNGQYTATARPRVVS